MVAREEANQQEASALSHTEKGQTLFVDLVAVQLRRYESFQTYFVVTSSAVFVLLVC